MLLNLRMDSYSRTARLTPALLVALPASFLILIATSPTSWSGRIGGLVVASGVPVLVTQIVRDLGRAAEADLFTSWGGEPSTALLRWSGPEARPVVRRRHELLSRLFQMELPSLDGEQEDPAAADHIYAMAVAALREHTRDASRFPLLLKELTSYGFRRNLFGCRRIGIGVVLLSAVATPLLSWMQLPGDLSVRAVIALLLFDGLYVLLWWRLVNADWVRVAAKNYAQRLLACAETLAVKETS
jgi:hypothetical protein